jgi:hypothetical protein
LRRQSETDLGQIQQLVLHLARIARERAYETISALILRPEIVSRSHSIPLLLRLGLEPAAGPDAVPDKVGRAEPDHET